MKRKLLLIVCLVAAALVLALLAWGGSRVMKAVSTSPASRLPVTRVKRGDVTISVAAKGELSGGHTEMLSAPMTGGGDMAITYLREPGELVKPGDVVVKFDTTEQEFKLKEAEADLAEAGQQLIQAQADNQAKEEETRYALLSGESRRDRGRARSAPQSAAGRYRGAREHPGPRSRAKITCNSSNTTWPTTRRLPPRPSPFRKPRAIRPK